MIVSKLKGSNKTLAEQLDILEEIIFQNEIGRASCRERV